MTENIDEFWREPSVLLHSGLKKSSMRALVKVGKFPAPVKLGPRMSAWLASEVVAWMKARVELRRNGA